MKRQRGFEEVKKEFLKNPSKETKMPVRSDGRSAGCDFFAKETVTIKPNQTYLFWTDVKAYMFPNEFLYLVVRSSIGVKKNLMLKNTNGIIDSSYYGNPSNDGNIGICLYNYGDKAVTIEEGERIAQGIFLEYLMPDSDNTLNKERKGGFGSSGK